MKITAQQYISNDKDKNTYVSVFKHSSRNTDKKVFKEGDLYSIIYLSGTEQIPAERVAKFVWDGIVDGYLYSNSESTNESLKDSINEGVRKLRDLIRNDIDLEESGVNLCFTVVAQRKEGFYIGNFGENDIYVYRDNKLIDIVDILGKNKAQTAGLALKKGELLMVSTPTLLKEGISNFVGLKTLDEFNITIKNFASNLMGSEGFFVLEVSDDEKKEDLEKPQVINKKVEEIKNETNGVVKTVVKNIEKTEPVSNTKSKISGFLEKLKSYLIKFKPFFEKIKNIFTLVIEKTSAFLRSVFNGLLNFLRGKFGQKRWFKKASANLSQKIPRVNTRKASPKGMKIDGYRQKDLRGKRFKTMFVIISCLVLVVLGVNFTIKTKKAKEIHYAADTILLEAEDLLSKIESKINTDKNSAETYIYKIKNSFNDLPEGMDEEDLGRKNNVEEKILEYEDTLYKRVGVSDDDGSVMTYIDSRLSFGDNSDPTDIEIYRDNSGNEYLLVSDEGANAVFRIALYDKDVKRLPDNESVVKTPKYLSIGNTGVFTYDEDMGVLKAPFKDEWFDTFDQLSGLDITDIKGDDISEFIVLTEADNVYLLSRDLGAILKSGFSYGNSYNLTFSYITNESFVNSNDILADLSVYVVSDSLIRYNYSYIEQQQVEAPVTVAGYSGDLGSLTKGYTRDSLDYGLYIFDSSEKRFFKFEKPKEGGGEILHPDQILLEKQYVYRGSKENVWSDVKDFVVDTNEKYGYVLDGSTIWKVQL